MNTIYDILAQAQALRNETKLDSVSPERLGTIHEETLKYINEYLLLASSPAISKVYSSVAGMQGDAAPKSDLTGRALTRGQLVVIVPASTTDATAGDVYRYDGPSGNTSAWTFVAKIGAVPADAELSATSTNPPQNKVVTEKLTELSENIGGIQKQAAKDETDSIDITTEDGERIVHVDKDGVEAKSVRIKGKEVNTEGIEHKKKYDYSDSIDITTEEGECIVHIDNDGVEAKSVRIKGKEVNTEGIEHKKKYDYSDSIDITTEEGECIVHIDKDGVVAKINNLSEPVRPFENKKILFFGDSLVAASAFVEKEGGFVRLIAERNKIPYHGFRAIDSPSQDDVDLVGFKNIAKDGATLKKKEGSTFSIVERVKNWVYANSCDMVVVQGGTNDSFLSGEILSSYDGGYDIYTSLGALEEIFYHVTGLGIKCCYIIMHKVNYIADDYYDKAIEVCEKWGVPFINLTHSAGFYMSNNNDRHAILYSIHPSEWKADVIYDIDSKVMYDGKSYKSNIINNVGILPSSNNEAWQLVSNLPYDRCHLSDLGHQVISNKIESFIKSV